MARNLDTILVVDVESTCWRGEPPVGQMSEIIEIGLAKLNTKTLEIDTVEDFLIKPEKSTVSDFCTELTTITNEMLEGMWTFKEACNMIWNNFGSGNRIWASYGEYDKNQFRKCCDVFNVKYPFSDMHWNIKSIGSIFFGWPEMGMDDMLEKLNIPLEGTHHRGCDDAKNIAKVLIEILKRGRNE